MERNNIEMQAIAALENVGDVLLFLIDPTSEATTSFGRTNESSRRSKGLMSEESDSSCP